MAGADFGIRKFSGKISNGLLQNELWEKRAMRGHSNTCDPLEGRHLLDASLEYGPVSGN